MNKEIEEYIASLPSGDEAILFFRKEEYLNGLIENIAKHVKNKTFNIGGGNYNSKIFIVMPTPNYKKEFVSFLKREIFEPLGIELYDCYYTYYDKCGVQNLNAQWLEAEIKCINPEVIITYKTDMPDYGKKMYKFNENNLTEVTYIDLIPYIDFD